jgi:anaerobic selenocysteine-containing dehydrogenase
MSGSKNDFDVSRRGFLGSALLGGAAAVARSPSALGATAMPTAYQLGDPGSMLNSVCLQCNTGCGIRVKIVDGLAAKIEGNPYSPWTMVPPIDYATPLEGSARFEGALCPKGQAGLQSAYDPYRIVKVLKRSGKRGADQWVSIPFEKAIEEIVEGGLLFKGVPGEETRRVQGLRELWALRDPKLAADMSHDVDGIRAAKTADDKKAAIAKFKERFAGQLDTLIDPDHPDFGPKNNQVTFAWGRLKGGRSEFIKRFISDALGSTNAHGHTTVCQGSLYFTGKAMSDQFKEGKFTDGKKAYWQADTADVEFLLAIGSSYIEGGYGPTHHSRKLMDNLVNDKVKIAVVDPRFSKIAAKAWKWIPARPGSEGALALGMIRWILENQRYDRRFLSAANRGGAKAVGEQSWTNVTWLVKEDGALLRASEAGLAPAETRKTADGKDWQFDAFVAIVDGKPVAVDPNDETNPVVAEPLFQGEINGHKVKSGLQLVAESASQKSIEQYAEICGIEAAQIVDLAREFTSHGKRAVADPHRGVSQHTNGFYNVLAVYTLNALIGNFDWQGGLIKATTYDFAGEKEGQPYPFAKMHDGKAKPFGISVIRHGTDYEKSTIFAGYPAKRNWYPHSSDIYQEIIPSMGDAYPYPTKALFLYMASPAYALPAGNTNIAVLKDPTKIPLVIASDITIGETSMYADYVFPDLGYLERWEFQGSHPSIAQKVQPIRNPTIAPIPTSVTVFGEKQPICLESMILGIAERLGLPGYGADGLGKGKALKRSDDFYIKMVANVAAGDKPGDAVPDADDRELELFTQSRRHLPVTVFDLERWRSAAGEANWRKVVYLLNRGGRYQDYDKAFKDGKFTNKYGGLLNIYVEKLAKTRSAMTGKKLPGVATYLPIQDSLGRELTDASEGFDLHMITYREISQTKSRTVGNYWLNAIQDTNHVLLSEADAKARGIAEGDKVRVVSKSNPKGVWDLGNGREKAMIGTVKLTRGIRPGVMAFSLGRGHWAYGSSTIRIDGKVIEADPRRATGVHANAAMRVDEHFGNTCLVDTVGGSVSFYDTSVRLVKEA